MYETAIQCYASRVHQLKVHQLKFVHKHEVSEGCHGSAVYITFYNAMHMEFCYWEMLQSAFECAFNPVLFQCTLNHINTHQV